MLMMQLMFNIKDRNITDKIMNEILKQKHFKYYVSPVGNISLNNCLNKEGYLSMCKICVYNLIVK